MSDKERKGQRCSGCLLGSLAAAADCSYHSTLDWFLLVRTSCPRVARYNVRYDNLLPSPCAPAARSIPACLWPGYSNTFCAVCTLLLPSPPLGCLLCGYFEATSCNFYSKPEEEQQLEQLALSVTAVVAL